MQPRCVTTRRKPSRTISTVKKKKLFVNLERYFLYVLKALASLWYSKIILYVKANKFLIYVSKTNVESSEHHSGKNKAAVRDGDPRTFLITIASSADISEA